VIVLSGLWPWLSGLQTAPEALLQRLDERIGSERTSCAAASPQRIADRLAVDLAQESLPSGHHFQ
jgi:hypothetical protein